VRARQERQEEMESIVVFGDQVPVAEPAVPLGMNAVIPAAQFRAALRLAGYVAGVEEDAVLVALTEAGYNMPSSWVVVERSELIADAGMVPGRINALISEMQKCCVRQCGGQ
jgi:hypothetical protein